MTRERLHHPIHSLMTPPRIRTWEPRAALDGLPPLATAPGLGWKSLGDSLFERRRIAEALACYGEAARRGFDPAQLGAARWMCWMMLGRFERAWAESDELERLHRARHGPAANGHVWDGQSLEGRRVLLRCEHGLGDTIQFIRYLPLLRPRCRKLTLMAQRELWPLLERLPGVDRLTASWEVPPDDLDYDAEIEVMELPYLFRSTPATLPAEVPYLGVAAERVEGMRKRMDGGGACNVGLVWASSGWYAARSIPLELFQPLARLSGVRVYSLQFGAEREALTRRPELPIVDAMAWGNTIADTAALMAALDVIITPDTLAAHLAGALGRPTWTLLLHNADWRWMAGGERSPWYPTMRLFRQPRPGDWATPVARVTGEAARLTARS